MRKVEDQERVERSTDGCRGSPPLPQFCRCTSVLTFTSCSVLPWQAEASCCPALVSNQIGTGDLRIPQICSCNSRLNIVSLPFHQKKKKKKCVPCCAQDLGSIFALFSSPSPPPLTSDLCFLFPPKFWFGASDGKCPALTDAWIFWRLF